MKLRANRKAAREAVNAVRAFFESSGCVFQEVDEGNDYGKDAYVDLTMGQEVTGICVALQIKGGDSFKTKTGYRIPVDAKHSKVWSESTVPIAAIVYDPSDKRLRWCNLTVALRAGNKSDSVFIDPVAVLDSESLPDFRKSFAAPPKDHPVLLICASEEEAQLRGLYDCFALGRFDSRVLVAVRMIFPFLRGRSSRLAIRILAHLTPHPDILWGPKNWIGTEIKEALLPLLVWEDFEIVHMLDCLDDEEWDRGQLGEDVYMLLREDPRIEPKVERVACRAMVIGNKRVAFAGFRLSIYWAGKEGLEKFIEMTEKCPVLRNLRFTNELEQTLREFGYVSMF
jgi:hypothetical protein